MKKPNKKKIVPKTKAGKRRRDGGFDISPLTERGADYGYMLIPLGRKAPKVAVTGGDYKYSGRVRGLAIKSSGALRYVVEDRNRRLFIHNATQLNKPEGWLP